jgi:hypothetical protein
MIKKKKKTLIPSTFIVSFFLDESKQQIAWHRKRKLFLLCPIPNMAPMGLKESLTLGGQKILLGVKSLFLTFCH